MDISEKIDILSMDDDKIKQVGELLSNDASRSILKMLFKNTYSANEIAKEADISLPLVMYHLKKLQEANMVRVTNVGKKLESKDIKRYTTTKFALVIVADSVKDKVKESKAIKRSFSGFYKFASIAVVTCAAWFASMFAQQQEAIVSTPTEEYAQGPDGEVVPGADIGVPLEDIPPEISEPVIYPPDLPADVFPVDILISTVIALGVLAVGLIIERAIRSRRK